MFLSNKPLINWQDKAIRLMLLSAASTCILVVMLILLFIGKEALPFLQTPGWNLLVGDRWIPVSFKEELFGMLPLLSGSIIVTLTAVLVAVPVSICAAVYISEIATDAEKNILKPFIELLAGIPSVVLGFFGLVVLAPFIKDLFHLSSGLSALTGGLLLALMAAPTIISIAEDALQSVPSFYKQASLALGASPLKTTWKVMVPAALPGIIAAVMLGVGRVMGETMAVLMVTGNAAIVSFSPFESVRTMTATIAAEMGEVAFGSDHYRALFCVGFVLLLMTLAINLVSQSILKKYRMG